MKNIILLIAGIVVTALLLTIPAQIFELFYYDTEFSNEMYNSHVYFTVALTVGASAWGLAAIFYYAINSVSFSRWYHWLIVLGASMAVSSVTSYIHITNVMEAMQIDFSIQAFHFAIIVAALTAVLFAVASFSIRWWSSNCRHTPFPE